MNKRVYVSMLSLVIIFLVGLYIAKIFFPQEFVMAIQNEKIVAIGSFIDSHTVIYYICCGVTSFLTYWLYCCAVCKRKCLGVYENLLIVSYVVIVRIIDFINPNISTILSWTSFVFLPAILNGELKPCALVFTFHSLAQVLSILIRSLPMYLSTTNSITIFLLSIDMYFWLILFYIIYNCFEKREI